MPIINIQRRMAEQGRIRLGHKITGTSSRGKAYTRPAKLDRFRFTSPSERLINEVASRYGGTPVAWDNAGKAEFEVLSEAKSIPVIVVKGGFTQWYELWSKAGCIHRCDGEKDVTGAFCNPEDPAHIEATEKPTTRLSVMLSEVESLGVWRMESKGWNAAAELPSMAELAMHVGDLVPATLSLVERSSIIQTDKGPQTSRFVVPVLDLHVSKERLVAIAGGVGGTATEALDQPEQATAIEAPRPDYAAQIEAAAGDTTELGKLWRTIRDAGHMTDEIDARIKALGTPASPPEQPEQEVVEAELVDEGEGPDKGAIWQQLVAAAGQLGMSTPDLQREVEANTGCTVAEATAADLQAVLGLITTGEVAS